jgi:dienelactone hydrolase
VNFSNLLPALLLASSVGLRAQTLEVTPNRVMVDEVATIRATGLQPNEHVSIHAELIDGTGDKWSSQAEFIADAQGAIDTSKQPPVAGSYKKDASAPLQAMGLVWSMMPASRKETRYQPPRNFGAQTIEFQLMRGTTELATAHLEQVAMAEGIERVTLRDAGLRGVLFLPPGQDKHPGILVLGGSEGGVPARRAAWFASHGYAALALAYFRYEDLPNELAGIPLEYFGRALSWMARQPQIDADHIGVSGTSRGGELALQLGSMYPVIKAVVAYVPANVRYRACCGFTSVPYTWTWTGKPLAFGEDSRAAIDVERTQGPILLISGEADGVWSSSSMADSVIARLKKAHFSYSFANLKYPQAGHASGRPEIVPAWEGRGQNPLTGREVDLGGTPKGNAESTLDAIPKVLAFLKESLHAQ